MVLASSVDSQFTVYHTLPTVLTCETLLEQLDRLSYLYDMPQDRHVGDINVVPPLLDGSEQVACQSNGRYASR